MELQQAIKKILDNWNNLHREVKDGHEAVWVAKSDIADSYEVDEEWIGVKGNGDLVWAYASGCSCWDGDYDTAVEKTVKVFNLNHKWSPEEWEEKIIKFAESNQLQVFDSYYPH
jgi:hypothetical protein